MNITIVMCRLNSKSIIHSLNRSPVHIIFEDKSVHDEFAYTALHRWRSYLAITCISLCTGGQFLGTGITWGLCRYHNINDKPLFIQC